MASSLYFQVMGDLNGPVTAAQLKRMASIGHISVDTLVRKGEVGDWVSAEKVQGLFDPVPQLVPESLPPVPPPPPPIANRLSAANGDGPPTAVVPLIKKQRQPRSRPVSLRQWLIYLLDPMFERFLTPWIIRATWLLLVVVAILVTTVLGYGHVSLLSDLKPDLTEVHLAEQQLASAKAYLQAVEPVREMARQAPPGSRRTTDSAPARATESPRVVSPLEEAKRAVANAESRLANARAAVPSKLELTAEHLPLQVVFYLLEIAACTLGVLWLRVILEGGIVLFSIVTKLGSIDERLAALNQAAVPPST